MGKASYNARRPEQTQPGGGSELMGNKTQSRITNNKEDVKLRRKNCLIMFLSFDFFYVRERCVVNLNSSIYIYSKTC